MTGDWLATIRGDVRETLRKARVGYTDLSQNIAARQVTVKIRDAATWTRRSRNCASSPNRSVATCSLASPATTWSGPPG